MRQKSGPSRPRSETVVKDIRRRTRKQHSAEEKIRIVLEGLRGEDRIAEFCRREGIATSLYYSWSKEFLEAGKKRLAGDTARQATAPEVKELRAEAAALKERWPTYAREPPLKKSMIGDGETTHEVPAPEKLEIIRLVERSHLPTNARWRCSASRGPRSTSGYDRLHALGQAGLEDRPSRPGRVWDRIPEPVRRQIVDLLSRSPSCRHRSWQSGSPTRSALVSEASVCRLLIAHTSSPPLPRGSARRRTNFHEKTTRPNHSGRPTSRTIQVVGMGWFCLSTIPTTTAGTTSPGASHHHARRRRERRPSRMPCCVRLRQRRCRPSPALHGQRLVLHLGRPSPPGSKVRASTTFAARPTTRRPGAKSSAGHQSLKNRNPAREPLPSRSPRGGDAAFVDHYNHRRYHESLVTSPPPTSTSAGRKPPSANGRDQGKDNQDAPLAAPSARGTD